MQLAYKYCCFICERDICAKESVLRTSQAVRHKIMSHEASVKKRFISLLGLMKEFIYARILILYTDIFPKVTDANIKEGI